jgi:hypothetical protein
VPPTTTNAGMLDNLQGTVQGLLAQIMTVTSQGGVALFDICVIAALVFYLWAIIRSLSSGGGAVLETVAFRLLVLFALSAVVNGWPALETGLRDDILNFASRISNVGAVVPGKFTPSGIIATNYALEKIIYAQGDGGPLSLLNAMTLWKALSIFFIEMGSLVLAFDLLFANISLDVVFAGCAFLIGLIVSPWLSSFAMQYVGLIVGTLVFIILVGVFVGVGQSITLANIAIANKGALDGPAMLQMGAISIAFAVLSWIVPGLIASRIAGGAPILSAIGLFNAARQGAASFRF